MSIKGAAHKVMLGLPTALGFLAAGVAVTAVLALLPAVAAWSVLLLAFIVTIAWTIGATKVDEQRWEAKRAEYTQQLAKYTRSPGGGV